MELLSIEEAAWKIRNGSIIAYPTETVYGLGTIIYERESVNRIKEIKGLQINKPLSVIISKNKIAMLDELVETFFPIAQRLAKFFWPGPLTIIHESKKDLPDFVTGGSNYIGIRCSTNRIVNQLIDLVGHPIISTSANPTGKTPAKNFEEIFSYFNGQIDGILIFDENNVLINKEQSVTDNLPSTIVKVDYHSVEIVREGAIKKADILKKIYE